MLTALFPIFLVYYKTGLLFSTVLASSFFRFRSYSHFFFFFNSKVGKSGFKKKKKKNYHKRRHANMESLQFYYTG